MEKLLELLNSYEGALLTNVRTEWTEAGVNSTPEIIISRNYGFIIRLVDNDKIDFEKLNPLLTWYPIDTGDDCWNVLALLAIQDNPIEILISILK